MAYLGARFQISEISENLSELKGVSPRKNCLAYIGNLAKFWPT